MIFTRTVYCLNMAFVGVFWFLAIDPWGQLTEYTTFEKLPSSPMDIYTAVLSASHAVPSLLLVVILAWRLALAATRRNDLRLIASSRSVRLLWLFGLSIMAFELLLWTVPLYGFVTAGMFGATFLGGQSGIFEFFPIGVLLFEYSRLIDRERNRVPGGVAEGNAE